MPPRAATKVKPKAVPVNRLTVAEAAKAIGRTSDFVLALTLSGARPPDAQGGGVVEIDYDVEDDEVTFTSVGVDRFLTRCPVGELVTAAQAAERLGIHRSQVSALVYTGVQTVDGVVVRLPVWQIGGGEYVTKADLESFAAHHKAAAERRAAREHAKKYQNRGRKPAQP